jgi:triphosphoribosyl-dephospho-CoA synthase
MRFEDFELSAAAVGAVLAGAGAHPVGDTILRAVRATRRVTSANTNLGIVLLLAPLARAAAAALNPESFRGTVRAVLAATTVDDAARTYDAIRLAAPGGLGDVPEQGIASAPTASLLEVMRLAAARDDVAHEYATAFAITFGDALPVLAQARRDGLAPPDAVVELYLTLLSRRPDTLIARKSGRDVAAGVSAKAGEVLAAGGVRTPEGRAAIVRLDEYLRDAGNRLNPGTTADLTAAALFVDLLGSGAAVPPREG